MSKIAKIEIYKAQMALKRPFRIAIGEMRQAPTLFVRIHSDRGVYGTGEANLFTAIVGETLDTALAAATDLAKLLLGMDPGNIEACVAAMRQYLPSVPTTRSAFDMALYDLLGKQANLPLYALLGGARRRIYTDNTVGLSPLDEAVEQALEIQSRGFPAVKVKVGTTAIEDIERLRRIRNAVGPDLPLRIDANQGWSVTEATRALREMEALGVQYCEQPVPRWDIDGMKEVRAATTIPIMADESVFDEHDALRLVTTRACDYLNIKLAKSSGIHTALKINAVAEAAGIHCMVGCMIESRLGLTGAAHLVSARPNIVFADLDGADMLVEDPIVGGLSYAAGGAIDLPDGPGLGADVSPSALESFERIVIASN